jgi:hypothetical protein
MTTLLDFSRNAAKQFLNTAVFIDDHIFERTGNAPIVLEEGEEPKLRKPVFSDRDRVTPETASTTPAAVPPFHPKELVASFAKDGIVCALYEPDANFTVDEKSEVFDLCEKADLIVLDWDFFNDAGARVRTLVTGLVEQNQSILPHHLRLVAVYTTDASLQKVTSSIYDALISKGIAVDKETGALTTLVCGATRIIVLGKPGITRTEEEKQFTIQESALASVLVEQFAHMSRGLLPSWALMGMAAVRRNSRRVLDRFRADLDGPFLMHRALVMSSGEALDQLPRLLCDELLAVVEDSVLTKDVLDATAAAIGELSVQQPSSPWQESKKGESLDITPIVRSLLPKGSAGLAEHKHCNQVKKITEKLPALKISEQHMSDLKVAVGGAEASKRLAELFGVQTSYAGGSRHLTFGTIVRTGKSTGSGWDYSLCLMPACDSIRLRQKQDGISFPFWRLTASDAFAQNIPGRGIVVCVGAEFFELLAHGKPSDQLWMDQFEIDTDAQVVLSRKKDSKDTHHFVGRAANHLEWVGQLKPLHAQRIAHDVGQALSRVGLTEAEWVRLMCER